MAMVASEGALGELGWVGIDRDDPAVRVLREALSQRAGSHSLEVVDAADGGDFAQRAAALFRRDGFVLVASVLDDERLRRIRAGLDVVVREMVQRDPNMQPPNRESGLAGSHRYSIRDAAAVFGQHAAWAALVDPPALHEVLEAIWNSRGYICAASAYPNGGDFVLCAGTHSRVLLAAAALTVWFAVAGPAAWSTSACTSTACSSSARPFPVGLPTGPSPRTPAAPTRERRRRWSGETHRRRASSPISRWT